MVKPVVITPIARNDLDNVMHYLVKNWSFSVLENFLALYEAKIAVISEYPTRYPFIDEKKSLRKAVLTKHNIILYREKPDHIEIISIFDTRQDPDKINKITEQ
jgi:plasmid stabilization system protein ParE